MVDGDRADPQVLPLVAGAADAHRGAAVVADHPQHGVAVGGEAGEGAVLGGQLGAGGVAAAGQDRGEGAAESPPLLAVVGDAALHQHRPEVRVAQSEGAIAPAELGDLLRGEARHQHRDLEHHRPDPGRVLVALPVEAPRLRVEELEQVDRREVARGVVEEHVLRAGVARVDATPRRAGVPRVDRGVVLDAGVGAAPCREDDLVPEVAGLDGLRGTTVGPADERPVGVRVDRVEERVGQAHRVVAVLAADGEVRLAVEVVVEPQAELLGEFALLGGEVLEALDERGHLELLAHLPVHELRDVGVVDVEADHLGGAAGGAARLDRAGGAVADLEEAHQAAAAAAARERLVLAAKLREVGAGAGAVLEETGLPHPQVHDAALGHEVVADRLDEAGVGLRVAVGAVGEAHRAGGGVGDPVALRRAGDPVGEVEAGVEPLRAVRRRHLREQHVGQLVVERGGVLGGVEVAVLLAPVPPAAGEAVHHLPCGALRTEDRLALLVEPGGAIGAVLRHARLAEVLAHDDVGGELAPARRHLRIVHLEDGRTVGVGDAGGARGPLEAGEDVRTGRGEATGNSHGRGSILKGTGS